MNYIILFFLCSFILSIIYTRNIFISFLFLSFFLSFSEYSHLSIAMILISILWGYANNMFKVKRYLLLLYLIFLVFFACLISLSYINGASLVHIIGKLSRVSIILFFLFSYSTLPSEPILGAVKSFVISSLIGSVFLYLLGYYDDLGFVLYRISGLLNDANYFALICLIFIIFCDSYTERTNVKTKYLRFLLFLFILFSQSWSSIILYFLYLLFYKYKLLTKAIRKIILFFPFVIIILILFFLNCYGEQAELYYDWVESDISLKFNSLLIRFNTILNAYLYMESHPLIFYFGMGSGRSLEIGERVFHNLYFQQFFDHGWIYYVFFQAIISWRLTSKLISDRQVIAIFLLMLHNVAFDNFYSFLFSFTLLILDVGRFYKFRR